MICKWFRRKKPFEVTHDPIEEPIEIIVKEPEEIIIMHYERFKPKFTGRRVDWLVMHCTATREGQHIDVDTIRRWHMNKGWSDIGYHFVIYLDGTIVEGRPITRIGAHVKGYNKYSIGITYVGGVDRNLAPKDTRTEHQKRAIVHLLKELKKQHPFAKIQGHRDFSPDLNNNGIIEPWEFIKICPSFDAKNEFKHL